jgi:hypothetical protein
MERELNRKVTITQEKEREGSLRVQLDNMTPKVSYSSLIRNFHFSVKNQQNG